MNSSTKGQEEWGLFGFRVYGYTLDDKSSAVP